MRPILLLISAASSLLALGCGDDTTVEPDARPPFDAGQDAGWTSEWRHEASVEVHDDTACEPWEPVASPLVRGLPADPTPRVLWHFRPSEDPLYAGPRSRFESRVEAPVVSPDGTIWVRGPSFDQVMQLERDGTLRNWYGAGGAAPDDLEDTTRQGPIAVAPNGHLISVVYAQTGQRGSVSRIDPTLPRDEFRPTSVLPFSDHLSPAAVIAIGPDGVVYVANGNRIYATCRAERLMWTLTIERAPGEEDVFGSGRVGNIWVEEDGSVSASGGMQRIVRVARGVVTNEEAPHEELDREVLRQLRFRTPNVRLFNLPPADSGRYRWLVQIAEGDVVTNMQESGGALSPTGELWFASVSGGLAPWPYPYISGPRGVDTAGPWFDDGSWLVMGSIMSRRRYDHDTESEALDWAVDVRPGASNALSAIRGDMVIDDTGVGYFVLFGGFGSRTELLAVQLDGLPPASDRCVDDVGCNPQRDRYVRPLAE